MSSHSPNLDTCSDALPEHVQPFWEILIVPVIGFVIISRCLYDSSTGNDIWFLISTLTYSIIFLRGRDTAVRINWVDLSLFLVVITEIICYFNSTYPPNSLKGYQDILFLFLFYSLVRFHIRHDYQRTGLFLLLSLFGLCLSAAAMFSFYRYYSLLSSVGFEDPTTFRSYFYFQQPPNVSVGEWITIFLMLLPFPVLLSIRFVDTMSARGWALLFSAVALLLTSVVTFSRGLYFAIAAYFVFTALLFWLYRLPLLGRFVRFSALAFLLLILVVLVTPLRAPVMTTASMFKTTSQVRSFEGRTAVWKASWEIVKAHPFLGIGAFNFPIQYAAYKKEDSVYVSRTLNIFLQLAAEKGVVGLLAYCLLFFSFFKVSHDNIRHVGGDNFQKAASVIFMASCFALLVRDLSYSSTFVNKGVSALLWLMFAVSARPEPSPEEVAGKG
jgi:O-antigen ligase